MIAAAALLAACETPTWADPPPGDALNSVSCDTGGRHGPTGVMDWTCVDHDGQRRTPVRSLHEVIDGEANDDAQRRAARRDRLAGPERRHRRGRDG